MAQPSSPTSSNGFVGRVRGASVSIINANPQLGMWQAAGTAIAQAPNLTELRDAESGGDNIAFNAQGHSARYAVQQPDGDLTLVRTTTAASEQQRSPTFTSPTFTTPTFTTPTFTTPNFGGPQLAEDAEASKASGTPGVESVSTQESSQRHGHGHMNLREKHHRLRERQHSIYERHKGDAKEKWGPTIMNGLKAFWKFFKTPAGFLITIYGLNVVAWGAMLFFLLLKACPAMNHPSADDDSSPRKKWLEIDSQILNALFCVTGFGLAPWRFRDLWFFITAVHFKNLTSMQKLVKQNKSWFRPPAWAEENGGMVGVLPPETFTGEKAPPTAMWKLAATIWLMVANTLLQAVLCYFMWGYNRFDRPGWATGTFIALGCGVAMLAGLISWWEGRKVKKLEGPEVKVIEEMV